MQTPLSLTSTRDANPSVFTLTFNVSDGPPTDVTCADPFTIASGDLFCVVINWTGFVTVTVRMRQVFVLLEIFNIATNSYDNIFNLDFMFSLYIAQQANLISAIG